MAENCGRADLCGVGLKSIAANLGVASPAVDLPWLAGPKSRQPRRGEPRRGPAVDCRASARKEEESEAEKKFVAAAIKDKAAGPGRNLVKAADDADEPKKGQFFYKKNKCEGLNCWSAATHDN